MKNTRTIIAVALLIALLAGCAGLAEGAPTDLADKVLTDLPTSWDLTTLYADEAAFEADMARVDELLPEIEALRGTLDSAEGILNYLENPALLEAEGIKDKAIQYALNLQSLDASDPWAGKAYSQCHEVDQKIRLACAFMPSEIMAMPLEKRQEILSDERLAPYAYYLRKYADPDHVVLSEEAKKVDAIWESNSECSYNTYNILEQVELPVPTFTYPDGTEGTLTEDTLYRVLSSPQYDHEFRKELRSQTNAMRASFANTYASLLEGGMRAWWAEAQVKGFDTTLAAALDKEDIQPEIYDRIIEFAHSLMPKVHEYNAIRKIQLGLDEMLPSDAYVPLSDYDPKELSYDEAVNVVRSVIAVWGDEYLAVFDRIIESPQVDVYSTETKMSGGYMSFDGDGEMPAVLDGLPLILLNYGGTEFGINEIAHEMGHAVYGELSSENQNVYNNAPTIFTHEVASIVNELLLDRAKVRQAQTKAEKLYWMEREIELFNNTVLGQCMYSEFEDYCYRCIESGASLNADDMAQKWLALNREYDGDAYTYSEDYGIDWARIPHFYNQYYVFRYATSTTYAASICKLLEEKGQEEIDAYLAFLKAGNSASPAELLKIAGVDPLADETYEAAAALFTDLIDEYIATVSEP